MTSNNVGGQSLAGATTDDEPGLDHTETDLATGHDAQLIPRAAV